MFTEKRLEISPVRDTYSSPGECPLCTLMDKAERTAVDGLLGGAVMVPEARVAINESGFCPDHYGQLFRGGNKLGLALSVSTHLEHQLPFLKAKHRALLDAAARHARIARPSGAGVGNEPVRKKRGLFGRRNDAVRERLDDLERWLGSFRRSCLVCTRLESTLARYRFTIIYLWRHDADFADALRASRGFCLEHLPGLLTEAETMLPRKLFSRFLEELLPLQESALAGLLAELDRYAAHFDYRNHEVPWGSERDSLPRLLRKLTGRFMSER